MSGDPNLEKFLSEVDEVSGVIQGLVAGNDEANEKADKLLKKRNKRDENLGFNSSRINKVTDDPPGEIFMVFSLRFFRNQQSVVTF